MVGYLGRRHHQLRQVLGAGDVLVRQARRLDEMRMLVMPSSRALAFMALHAFADAARVVAAQGMRRAVLGGHERQVHQVTARQAVPAARREAETLPRPYRPRLTDQLLIQRLRRHRVTTSAVMSLVIEAIGMATSELREYRTEECVVSSTRAALERRAGPAAEAAGVLQVGALTVPWPSAPARAKRRVQANELPQPQTATRIMNPRAPLEVFDDSIRACLMSVHT